MTRKFQVKNYIHLEHIFIFVFDHLKILQEMIAKYWSHEQKEWKEGHTEMRIYENHLG